ncbi:MAG: DUF4132 domain-containing protein, partial [Micrococcales bacterium]|nr:DUF4132 domain-containing protein [Micrococcales bacterium]
YLVVADHGPAVLDQAVSVNPLLDPAVAQARQRRAVLGADVPVALPPYEPVPDEPLTVAEVERMLARSHAQYGSLPPVPWTWTPCTSVQADDITGDDIAQFVAMANGTASPGASPVMALLEHMGIHQAVRLLPGLGLHHRLRLAGCAGTRWGEDVYIYAIHPGTDLRAVHDALVTHNYPPEVATTIVADRVGWSDPKASWPWLAQHPEQARPWLDGQGQTMALRVFASARYVPPALAPKVASIALGNAKAPRRLAQQALVNHPGARLLAEPGLAASKPETRAAAARWLAVLGDAAAVGPLRAALATEMSQMVRAAMLDALEALGADLDAELSPAALTAEAATGTKRPPPAAMAWFPFDALPALRWPDGSPVAPHVARWWVVLAIKTKNPDGSGVLDRYLSRLDPQSADELGRMVLDAWVTHTTAHPDPAASQAHARMVATRVHAHACPPGVWDEFMANDYAVHQRTVIGTGANDKGVLALTTRMSGRVLASVASEYVRTFEYHSQPLLTAVCANGDRACAQLLVSLAQRPARTSTQATAAKLVEHLAEVRGWTTDEVADRAIPTAGFEPSFPSPGPLDWSFTLDLGARQALARISPDGSVVASVDGRVVKTLPAARTDDDPALFTAAKKHLTAVRIEVKTITATQTRRLHEAMCTRRSWSVDDWLAFVDHPLMGPVATRVIWTQDPGTSFRLTDDATCINLDDETITLDPAAPITVAHTTTLGPQATTRWREHFADYEVVPALFQLDATIPPLPPTTTTIDDHEGHATDCGTAHTLATARWYTRDDSAVDGWTLRYTRVFAALDVTATIELTRDLTGLGHAIPLDTPAFTRTLTFRRARTLLPLADLPPALVAECYDDYTTLASGPHDPCWRAKTHS